MEFAALADHFDRLDSTTKRLEMTQILVEALEEVDPDDMEVFVRLLQGKVRPDWEGVELGLAEKMVLQVLARAAGLDTKKGGVEEATKVYHDAGDLGLAAERLLAKKQGAAQVGLMAFGNDEPDSLTLRQVYDRLVSIATASGAGSQEDKQQRLWKLLTDVGPREARYVIRTVTGRLRLGVADMTFLDALAAWHIGRGVRSVTEMTEEERAEHEGLRKRLEHAFDLQSDLAVVAATLAREGPQAVEALGVVHGVPLRPMAAERLKTLGEILEKHGTSALEYKYDGLRIQAHVSADPNVPVKLFSRRLEDLTDQFPDVQQQLREAFRGTSAIVEGECVAVDPEGRMRPFQDISRRRGRKTGLGEDARQESSLAEGATTATTVMDEVPVAVYLFDCMADGQAILDLPYMDRRARIESIFALNPRVQLSTMEVCDDEAGMESFFQRAVADGAEGVMCKALDAPYKAGNRGFDWIKFKTDYTEELVDTMDLVVVGAFVGRGRRAGWYGALLMATYDPDTGTWPTVCKLGTGFDDATLMSLKERFAAHQVDAKPSEVITDMEADVWFRPATVMEVQAAELTISPVHKTALGRYRKDAGLAARFPRFSGRWRDDKGPEQATTVDEIAAMFESQTK